jgi:glycosyltransferase involved in cell wall biosynthesis
MPQVLIEAMARGRIVIGNDTPGITELIGQEGRGVVYRKDDCAALADVLASLPYSSSAIAHQGTKAYRFARQFAWESIIDQLERIIARRK